LASWLRGPLRDWAEDLLDPVRMNQQGFLNPAPVTRAWASLRAGESLWEGPLWNVLMWQAWLAQEKAT
jgi:asparagine synthase (glutamine-hydrolysing)